MQKKAEILGNAGCYKEAKSLRKKVKFVMAIEQERHM
jgi:hypothetical protein